MRKEKNAEVHFISRDLEGNLHDKITAAGFLLHCLPRHPLDESLAGYNAWLTVPPAVDAEETKATLREIGRVDRLVVDNYALDISWERAMRSFVDEIFVIDDLANRKHDCDVLLDQNFYLDMDSRYIGLVPDHCKLLLGPYYALLREEFYKAKKHVRERTGKIHNILVFYGGSDNTNETIKALRALALAGLEDVVVQVVVGGSNPHKEEIEAFCKRYPWMEFACQVDNMAERMNAADLALGAGGSTTWERCFLGLPAIVTAVAENQVKGCEACALEGWILYLGLWTDIDEDKLLRSLKRISLSSQLKVLQKISAGKEMQQFP